MTVVTSEFPEIYSDIIGGVGIYDWDVDVYDYVWICPVCGIQFIKFEDLVHHIISSSSEGHIKLRIKLRKLGRVLGLNEFEILRIYKWIRL